MNNASEHPRSMQKIPILLSLIKLDARNSSLETETYKNLIKESLENELTKIIGDKEASQQLFENLFLKGIPIDTEFYIRLIQLFIPNHEDNNFIKKVRGIIWASARLILPKEKFEELLTSLLSLEWNDFFIMHASLPTLFTNTQVIFILRPGPTL